jgi:hypothetical protein
MMISAVFWLSLCCSAPAASLFEDQTVLEVELAGPIDALIRNREDRQELPFVLRSGGSELDVNVRVRGKSRLEVCRFPPLRLNFQHGAAEQTAFAGQDKLKLVTHCSNGRSGEQDLLKEYLAYRIFGLLSDVAYRVRLLHIRYSDTDNPQDSDTRYAFVIEPKGHLATRVDKAPLQLPGVSLSRLNSGQLTLMFVFQYMIGNTDWSLVAPAEEVYCCHNGKLFGTEEDIFYVPYDFDLSGIVNASYAKPDPSLRLRNVRSRRYRGFCTDRESVRTALRRIVSQREDIYELARNTPGLAEKEAEQSVDYLQAFFDKADDEEKLLKSFDKRCLK